MELKIIKIIYILKVLFYSFIDYDTYLKIYLMKIL